jgi:hypothetical protein
MSSALSAQLWNTSHPNVPTREMTKQSLLEEIKEASLSKLDYPIWQTGVSSFGKKFQNF